MGYNEECVKFFWVGRKLFGGRFLRFMSGMKNETDLLLNREDAFSPQNSRVNFACPDKNVLKVINPYGEELPDTCKPGFQFPMIQFKSKRADPNDSYVLMLDGKKIKRGTDVDLLGHETTKTLKQRENERDEGVKLLKETVSNVRIIEDRNKCISKTSEHDKTTLMNLLVRLVLLLSVILRELRLKRVKKQCALTKMEEEAGEDWRKSKFAFGIDLLKTLIWKIDNIVDKALHVIRVICKTGAQLNNVSHLFADSDTIILNRQENLKILKSPPNGSNDLDTSLIKQRSDRWFEERRKVKVTGSTIFKALGCDGLKRQKEHFNQVINNVTPEEPSETQQLAMKHGTETEIHQIATMCCIIMPFLYPDLVFQEEGFYSYNSILVSQDGNLRAKDKTVVYAFEGKSPTEKSYTSTLHEQVPARYVTQTLYEQKVLNAEATLYLSWTNKSCTLFKVTPNDGFCETIENEIKKIYEKENPKCPTRLSQSSKDIKKMLNDVSETYEFLGEFPAVKGLLQEYDCENNTNDETNSPFFKQKLENKTTASTQQLATTSTQQLPTTASTQQLTTTSTQQLPPTATSFPLSIGPSFNKTTI